MNDQISVDYGIEDWQILSRIGGTATVVIGGEYIPQKENQIYLRVVDENSNSPVIPWFKADMLEGSKWQAEIKDIPEGGLYQLETINKTDDTQWIENGIRGQVVSHFGVGDIFLIAGQSNASGTGLGIAEDAPMLGVANFKYCKKWELATHPLKDRHSPFISFAKKVYKNTGIPIGICDCAVGGVPISRWLPDQKGDLYNHMFEIAKTNNIIPKAILFYQGESDAIDELYLKYEENFSEFVTNIRRDFQDDSLPIYTFQLNAHLDCRSDWEEHDLHWDTIREVQRKQADKHRELYVIPTIDIPMSDGIHNSRCGNVILGERLANYVLKNTYKKQLFATAPVLDSVTLTSDTSICIKYRDIQSMIMIFHADGKHVPFEVKDDMGNIEIERVTEVKDTIELRLARACVGDVLVSCQTGARNKRYIQDLATNIPVLTFLNVKAVRGDLL